MIAPEQFVFWALAAGLSTLLGCFAVAWFAWLVQAFTVGRLAMLALDYSLAVVGVWGTIADVRSVYGGHRGA